MRKRFTNRQAFNEIFWEHVLFPGPLDAFRFWCASPGGPGTFDQEVSAATTVAAMQNESERHSVERGNRKLFAGRLTPGLDLLWPDAPNRIEEGHAAINAWFGPERATSIRLGKDLKRYGTAPSLLTAPADWTAVEGTHPSWRITGRLTPFTVQMQAFPNDHLYRLQVLGRVVWEFDDWPAFWIRDWPEPNQRQ